MSGMALEEEEDKHQQPNAIETSQSATQSALTLPTLVIVEILSRLPVDSLLRCRSVCKSWRSLISDPHFVKHHLTLSTRNNHYAHRRLIFSTRGTGRNRNRNQRINIKSCQLKDALYDNSVSALELNTPWNHSSTSVSIVGSCNGLVCIAVEDDGLFIWNPSTRKSNRLPFNDRTGRSYFTRHYGFGYEESSNDYKVVEMCVKFVERYKHETSVMIYSLRNGSWKNIGTFPHGMPLDHYAKFLNGALHWAADNDVGCDYSGSCSNGVVELSFDWHIICFDLAKETYGEILQPMYDEGDDYPDLTLGSLRECLCVLSNYPGTCADLWVMKVYGVEDSWTKLVSIPYLPDLKNVRFSVPLCISSDGKVLLELGCKLTVYDSKNNSFSVVRKFDKCVQVSTFVESLVSPMPASRLGDRL